MKAAVEQVKETFEGRISERRACGLMKVAVSTFRYRPEGNDEKLRDELIELSRARPRFGYRRLHAMLGGKDRVVNHKLVWRLYKEEGLALKRKRRKYLVRVARPLEKAQTRNEEWALDFVSDVLGSGRSIRLLNVADAYTRECVALEVDTSFASRRVTGVLDRAIAEHGAPRRIRSDNGPEFTSRHYLAWAVERGIELLHIQPGKPMQNGRLESLNGKLRDEFLNVSWFRNLFDARRQAKAHLERLNRQRSLEQDEDEEVGGSRRGPRAEELVLNEYENLIALEMVAPQDIHVGFDGESAMRRPTTLVIYLTW